MIVTTMTAARREPATATRTAIRYATSRRSLHGVAPRAPLLFSCVYFARSNNRCSCVNICERHASINPTLPARGKATFRARLREKRGESAHGGGPALPLTPLYHRREVLSRPPPSAPSSPTLSVYKTIPRLARHFHLPSFQLYAVVPPPSRLSLPSSPPRDGYSPTPLSLSLSLSRPLTSLGYGGVQRGRCVFE